MKTSLIFFLLVSTLLAQSQELSEVRNLYVSAAHKEVSCEKLIISLKNINETEQTTLTGYKACAIMMMAKYQLNPISKLNSFNDGKSLLDKSVGRDVNNIELRFLRFSAQCETPSFLGYTDNIDNDKTLIIKTFPYLNDSELQNMIRVYMRSCDQLTEQEKTIFNKRT